MAKKIIIIIYLIIQLILSILSQLTDNPLWAIVSFSIVALAFLMNFMFMKKSLSFLFTALALAFTVFSDVLLVLLDKYYLTAVISFILVQLFYFCRIIVNTKSMKLKKIHITLRISLSILSIIVLSIILKENTDLLTIASAICFVNLVLNVITSFINYKFKSDSLIFAIGLLLFMLCDFFVGINNIEYITDISRDSLIYQIIYNDYIFFPWLFYAPSQMLLGLSSKKDTAIK